MCTALTFRTKDHYFGRNLDLEYSYNESVTITPRNFPLHFRKCPSLHTHYAMIGMAYVCSNYPLYYDATNEMGLSIAGLNFPHHAKYHSELPEKDNIAPFEFLPWILGQCSCLKEACHLLNNLNILQMDFSSSLPLTPMHWLISDKTGSLVADPLKGGLKLYKSASGVLTNSPEFHIQPPSVSSIPGDWSSTSRLIKASFLKQNSVCGNSEEQSVSQFFHILNGVEHQRGCVPSKNGAWKITVYSSCCNTDKGIYYYKTYENSQITSVHLHKENMDSTHLTCFPLIKTQQIKQQN